MANEYLQRTPTSTGNRRVFTWTGWIKRNSQSSSAQMVFSGGASGDYVNGGIAFGIQLDNDKIQIFAGNTGTDRVNTSALYRDSSSWIHICVIVDTTSYIQENRFKLYVNGVLYQGTYDTASPNWPSINYEYALNMAGKNQAIGASSQLGSYFTGQFTDVFFVDGQALTPDVFGFYKQGKGYISVGSTQATDFRPGQWVPKTPRVIKTEINRRGGFGVNGFYLPMNDSRNFGADFHCDPNSIITLNEKLPQPRVGVATTASVGLGYTDALRADPYAANLVLALPFVSGGLNSGFGDYSHIIRGSGSAKSITVSGNTTIANVGTAETASVFYGSGAKFDGVDDYITIPNSSDFSFGSGDFTVECWANFGNFSTSTSLVNVFENATARRSWSMEGRSSGGFRFEWWYNGSTSQSIDASANTLSRGQWNHFAMVRKGPTITGYINGVAVGIKTDVGSQSLYNNTTDPLTIGALFTSGTPTQDFTGYIQDLRIYKGVAKYTGGFDVPKPYTPVGIATWRAVPDCTANNFATMNSVVNSSNGTNESFSNGNLTVANGEFYISTVGLTTGKWYWEYYESAYTNYAGYGIDGHAGSATTFASRTQLPGAPSGGQLYIAPGRSTGAQAFRGTVYNTAETINITHPTITLPITSAGTVYAVALDLDSAQGIGSTGAVHFYINGTRIDQQLALPTIYQGISTTGNVVTPFTYAAGTQNLNFGQNPTFSGNTTAGTYTDSNGKGLFKYQPPSGFLALCEDNLPTPAISDPGEYFKTVLYTGDDSEGRNIVGVGFTPDLIWFKARNTAVSHVLNDSVRGVTAHLNSDSTSAESIPTYPYLNSMNNDGFSLRGGTSSGGNISGRNMVAWCWRAGAGTTSTNTNGSITSVVSVNQDAGFSIVSYRSNGTSGATVGHSLARTPSFIIVKMRSSQAVGSADWAVYHKSLGATKNVWLNATNGANTSSAYWNNTEPTSSVFSLGNDLDTNHTNGYDYISYCWAEIEGFSKFGSYVGNNSSDGPMVWCGFKPAVIIIKSSSGVDNWRMYDNARGAVNGTNFTLYPNLSNIEDQANDHLDFLSNGFKLRGTNNNGSGVTYIFAAWAESPFQTANSK